jgi:hypothetical protein
MSLPVKTFLGEGCLGKRNALQLLHDLSDLQTRINGDFEMCLRDLLEISWKIVDPDIPATSQPSFISAEPIDSMVTIGSPPCPFASIAKSIVHWQRTGPVDYKMKT